MSANSHHQGDVTVFDGYFQIDKPLDEETAAIWEGLQMGLCVARDVNKLSVALGLTVKECIRKYGKEGQYYLGPDTTSVLPKSDKWQYHCKHFKSEPPYGRQGWDYHPEDHTIRADGMEKFYCYPEWITLLVREVLAPRGYVVNGSVSYENRGYRPEIYDPDTDSYKDPDEEDDFDPETLRPDTDVWGTIEIVNNDIYADHPVWMG